MLCRFFWVHRLPTYSPQLDGCAGYCFGELPLGRVLCCVILVGAIAPGERVSGLGSAEPIARAPEAA